MLSAYKLGASLYIPAVHSNLYPVFSGRSYPELRSVIACTEDAISDDQVEAALDNLATTLPLLSSNPRLMRFIRVRNPEVLRRALALPHINSIHGFVFPKVTMDNIGEYMAVLGDAPFVFMPTLETAEVFDPDAMRNLCAILKQDGIFEKILAIRIGGSDLMKLLHIKRVRGMTIYDTPLALVLSQLAVIFKPQGFAMTSVVCDYIDDDTVLLEEVRRDRAYGFCGKTAIHPRQIGIIERGLGLDEYEVEAASRLLDPECPAVFKHNGAMYERAVHQNWARHALARAQSVANDVL